MVDISDRCHLISHRTTRPLAQWVFPQSDKWEDRLSVQLCDSPRF